MLQRDTITKFDNHRHKEYLGGTDCSIVLCNNDCIKNLDPLIVIYSHSRIFYKKVFVATDLNCV